MRYTGDPLDIGFNANYLLEILRYIPTDEVKMTFKAPERASTLGAWRVCRYLESVAPS